MIITRVTLWMCSPPMRVHHMKYYHGGPTQSNPTLKDLAPYLPRVFDKIASNLEYYVTKLEIQAATQADNL